MRAVIRDDLAGKRIAVTGSTGFLGTALVERLLRSVPECELMLHLKKLKVDNATDNITFCKSNGDLILIEGQTMCIRYDYFIYLRYLQ